MNEIKTMLVTTDFSETSRKAFPLARGLAHKFGARIIVAHVEDDRLPPLLGEYAGVDLGRVLDTQHGRATRDLERLAGAELGSGTELQLRVVSGTPHVEIVRMAEETHADLIVMATHGRGFISHAILGSTTERVLRRAPCPVLVVRDAGRQAG